jgi:hypothetical protein
MTARVVASLAASGAERAERMESKTMSASGARRIETAGDDRLYAGSVTEDYVGLARYLAEAIVDGQASFDDATTELAAAATDADRASLERAARRAGHESLVARVLARATGGN